MVNKRLNKGKEVSAKKKIKTDKDVKETLNDLDRCKWCESHELYVEYHDKEWGRPVYDDDKLFEMISLEGAQAGLNWLTILKKREGYRKVFQNFQVSKVAKFTDGEIERALLNPNVVRHKGKLSSVVHNSKLILELQGDPEYGSFSNFVWRYATTERRTNSHCATNSSEAQSMSRDLKKRGFRFVGPTTCYAFMQACGIVNATIVTRIVNHEQHEHVGYTKMIDSARGKNTHAHPFGKRGYGKKRDSRVCVLCKPEAFIHEDDVRKAHRYQQELRLQKLSSSQSCWSAASTSGSKSKSFPLAQENTYQHFSLKLQRLLSSEYRFRHKLTQSQLDSILKDKVTGFKRIQKRVQQQLRKRLKYFDPNRDGTQSPFRTHFTDPIFHSLALCCRGCVEQWHMIPHRSVISEEQLKLMEDFFMFFIDQITDQTPGPKISKYVRETTPTNSKCLTNSIVKADGKELLKSNSYDSLPLTSFMIAEYSSAPPGLSDPEYVEQRYDSSEWFVFETESHCFRAKKIGPGINGDIAKTRIKSHQTAQNHSVVDLTSEDIQSSSQPTKKLKVENQAIRTPFFVANPNEQLQELQFQQDLQMAIELSLKQEKQ